MIRDKPSSDERLRLSAAADSLSRAIRRAFEIDTRALAAFRIAIGALLLVDLALRSRDLVAFYTDSGVLPREALYSDYANNYTLHALSGEAWAQALLFGVAGAFALGLLVGYRTRLMTVVSWLLLVSLHVRNPMVLNGGDILLRMLCFWGVFLPLGERWSIDARRRDRSPRSSIASVATMAVLLQVVLMYATNAIHKMRSDEWMSGEALLYIFGVDHYTILLGNHLLEFPGLLRAANYAWLVLIVAAPLLVVLRGLPRAGLATAFAGMHLGMLVTMRLDLFPLIVVAGLLPFYPAIVWGAIERRLDRSGVAAIADGTIARLGVATASAFDRVVGRSIPRPRPPTVGGVRSAIGVRAGGGRAAFSTIVPYAFLVLVVLSNVQAVDYTEVPEPAEDVIDTAKLGQQWRMFAPNPLSTTRWFVVPGELEDGSEIDALDGSSVDWDRPDRVEDVAETSRWKKYHVNVQSAGNTNHHSYFANYLCTRWNDEHETTLESVTVAYVYQHHDPFGEDGSATRVELLEYDCDGPLVQDADDDGDGSGNDGSGSDGPRITVEVTHNNESSTDDAPYDSR